MSKAKVKLESKIKPKPKCCIPQRTGVKCVAAVSLASGAVILLLSTVLIVWKSGNDEVTPVSVISLPPPEVEASSDIVGHDHGPRSRPDYSSRAKFIFMEPQTIAIMQIFSSMCLFSSQREFRKFSITWIVFHFFGIVINIAYLWNLPAWVRVSSNSSGQGESEVAALRNSRSAHSVDKSIVSPEPTPTPAEDTYANAYGGNDNGNDNNRQHRDRGGDEYFKTLTSFLLNFIGVNLCTEIFSILVLVDFLRNPEHSLDRV